MQKLIFTLLFAVEVLAQVPAGFTVVQATSKQVELNWTAGEASYVVERKAAGGVFTALPVNTDPALNKYTDASIAPYETYTYRVRVRLSPTSLSDPSTEITVGPPPVGLSLASPSGVAVKGYGLTDIANFGIRIRIALDSNGDPAMAYQVYSPQEDPTQSVIEFVSWNRVTYRWNEPRKVVVSGEVLGAAMLARDALTNTWAIAYGKSASSPRIAISRDNGVSWTDSRILDCGDQGCNQVALAMGGGKVHMATLRNSEGVRYITGNVKDAVSEWQSQLIPKPMGAAEALAYLDIAVDSANQPAVAFWCNTDSYNLILGYWRPDTSTMMAMDTNGYQNDAPEVEIQFAGTRARILVSARYSEEFFSRYDQNLWIVRDQGGLFSKPENLPSDGNQSLGSQSLAIGSGNQLSVAASVSGGNDAGVRCGSMKLIEQASETNPWTVCSPIAAEGQPFYDVNYPRIIYNPIDSRYIVFGNRGLEGQFPGIVVWRER